MKKGFIHYLKKVDIFGKRVYLTHETKEKYNTVYGSIISICFILGLFGYGLALCVDVWNNVVVSTSTSVNF